MFAMRATKLYEIYRSYGCYEDIPNKLRNMIERDLLRTSYAEAWDQTRRFFKERDPQQISRAEKEPQHKMALVFRSYLGLTSLWAKQGVSDRQIDYQIWCGPAMGAFNTWAKGSCLEAAEERITAHMGMNLMFGAAYLQRVRWLCCQGVKLPATALSFQPLSMEEINRCISPVKY